MQPGSYRDQLLNPQTVLPSLQIPTYPSTPQQAQINVR